MPTLPGFGGRLGRLAFFGWLVAFAVGMTVLTGVLIVAFVPRGGGAAAGPGIIAVFAIVIPLFFYGSLALQVKRVRDIGWSPWIAVLGWLGFSVVDALVGYVVPALARPGGGTTLGAVVNLLLALALLFWPGQPEDSGWGGHYHEPEPQRPVRQRALPGEPPTRAARQAPPQPAGFGRRMV